MFKSNAPGRDAVEIRRLEEVRSVASEEIETVLVGHDKQNVGTGRGGGHGEHSSFK
jgi:hypothetical protein